MLREPIDITIALTDFFRNAGEGERYAKFASDMGKAKSAEDIEGIRSRLKEYEFTNPAYVAKAQDDLNSQLTSYVAANKFAEDKRVGQVASSALNEAALLYPSWREERGATVPVSEFYNDYQGRIPGEALGLESYQRGFNQLSGGLSEGEDRAIKARERGEEVRNGTQFNTDIAEINNQSTLWPYKTFSDLETDVYDSAARARIKPEEARQYLDSQRQMWDKRTSLEPYKVKQGESTEIGNYVKNPFGYTGQSVGVLSNNAANDAAARNNIKSKEEKEDEALYKAQATYDRANSLVVDLTNNLLDTAAAVGKSDTVTEKDVIRARDNIAKAEADKRKSANDYGRRKHKLKVQPPTGYTYDFESDAWFNPNAQQGKRYWSP